MLAVRRLLEDMPINNNNRIRSNDKVGPPLANDPGHLPAACTNVSLQSLSHGAWACGSRRTHTESNSEAPACTLRNDQSYLLGFMSCRLDYVFFGHVLVLVEIFLESGWLNVQINPLPYNQEIMIGLLCCEF
jgi:hypothetical protein